MGTSWTSGWFQPVFIDIDEQFVLEGCGILRPDSRLVEPHQVEELLGESIAAVGQRFRIRKGPMQHFDDTSLPLHIVSQAFVLGWLDALNGASEIISPDDALGAKNPANGVGTLLPHRVCMFSPVDQTGIGPAASVVHALLHHLPLSEICMLTYKV